MRPNSPADRGILAKAPRKMKKNTVSLFRSSCPWAQVCKGVTFVVSKEASPPNLVLKSAGPFCRYVSRVLVHDLATNRKWYFLCNSWLSIDVGDCVLDKEFPVATEQDRKQFRYFLLFKQTLFTLFFHLQGRCTAIQVKQNKSMFQLSGLHSFKCVTLMTNQFFLLGLRGPGGTWTL